MLGILIIKPNFSSLKKENYQEMDISGKQEIETLSVIKKNKRHF